MSSVQNNENADFKSLILGLYRLAQDLRSLEDTALHQNTNDNSGIVIVGKGTLDQYGSKLVALVDDLLSQPEMAISGGDSEVLKQRIADLQAEKSDLENQLAAAHAQLDGYKQQEHADLMNSFNQQLDANSSAAAVSADQAQSAISEEVDDETEVANDDNESVVSDSAEEPATSESDSVDDDSEASSLNSLTDDDALSDDQSIVDGEIDGTIADDNSADVDNASAGLADDEPDAPATPDSDDKEAAGPATDGLFDDDSDSADDSNDTTDATDVAGGVGNDDGVDTNLQMDGTDSLDFDDSAFPNE